MTTDDRQSLFQSIVEAISGTLNMPVSIWVPDESNTTLTIAASVGLPDGYTSTAVLKIDQPSVTGDTFKTGEPQFTRDIQSDERWLYKEAARAMGWKAALSVPVHVHGKTIGVISIYTFVKRDFSDLEKHLLSDYATQIELKIEAEQRRQALARLMTVTDTIQQHIAQDPQAILDEIVKGACEVIGADCATLYPYDRHREDFYDTTKVAQHGLRHGLTLTDKPRKAGIAASIKQTGEIIVNDLAQEQPEMLKSVLIQREELKAFMGIALQTGSDTLGVLYVNFRSPHRFTDDEINTVRLFAHQASIALQNAHTLENSQVLQHVARDLSAVRDADTLLAGILKQATELMQCPYGAVVMHDRYRYAIGKTLEQYASLDEGLIGVAARTRQPVRAGDVAQDKRYWPDMPDTRSELDVPLIVRDEVIGVLNLESPYPNAFSATDEAMAAALASQAAIALDNARLFSDVNRQLKEQSILNEFSQLLIATRSVDDIIRELMKKTLRVFNVDQGSFWRVDHSRRRINLHFSISQNGQSSSWDYQMAAASVELEPEHSLVGNSAVLMHSTIYNDLTDCPYWNPEFDNRTGYHTKRLLSVPLLYTSKMPAETHTLEIQRAIGVIQIVNPLDDVDFTDQDRDFLMAIASMAATVIYTAGVKARQGVLSDIGKKLTEASRAQEGEILQTIFEYTGRLMDTNNMYIALYDEPTDTVRFGLAYVDGNRQDIPTRQHGRGRTEYIIHTKQSVFIATRVESEAWYASPERQEYVGQVFSSWVGVPMLLGERVIGVIATYHSTQDYIYDENDLELLLAIAYQAAMALDNARMFHNVNRRLRALVDLAREISESVIHYDEDQILAMVRNKAQQLMNVDNMYVALYDDLSDIVRFGVAYMAGQRISVPPRKAGQGRTEEIIRTKKPIFHETRAKAEDWYRQEGRQEYVGQVHASWIGAPMIASDRVLGVIATSDPEHDYVYNIDDLEILKTLANLLAVALDNSRNLRRLKALIEFGQAVTHGVGTSESALLDLIHQHARQLIDTSNMSIALYEPTAHEVRFGLAFIDGQRIDLQADSRWAPRRNGKGRTEEIIRTKQYLLHSTKAATDQWYSQPDREERIGDQHASWLGVPMQIGDRVLGVIATYHPTEEYAYRSEDVEILRALADYAAVALDNTHLTSEQVANRQLATLGTAMAALQHRINNSFNIIVPNVMRLRKRVDLNDAATVEILDIIDRNARLTSDIVRRIMEPLKTSEEQEVDLHGVINDVAQEKREEWEKNQDHPPVQVVPDLADTLPLFHAPIGQVAEIFRNCLDNAYRAMSMGGNLVVKTGLTDGIIEARIIDTGTGIPSAIRERLFQKPVPPKEQGSGAGLGLWLNRMILRGIGGDIQIENTDEHGTTVLVQIPVRRA